MNTKLTVILAGLITFAVSTQLMMEATRSHAQAEGINSRVILNEWLSGGTLPVNVKAKRPPEDKIAIEAERGIYIYRCAVG